MSFSKIHPSVNRLLVRRKHSGNSKYQFIQESVIPTLHFQKSLPRLPVPKLELTCSRYLAAQKPLLNEDDYKRTAKLITKFENGGGRAIQDYLISKDKANKSSSYISKPWFDMYLSDRQPLPINYNPVLVFNKDPRPEYNNPVVRVTNLIISSLRFHKSLNEFLLEPDIYHLNAKKSDTGTFRVLCSKTPPTFSWYTAYFFKAYPLDMSQYPNLFSSTRIPCIGKDTISNSPGSKHIIVQQKGHFYMLNVLNKNGYIIPAEEILAKIQFILNDNVEPNEFPLGILTTLERDHWAEIRKHLEQTSNTNDLKLIDSALFNVCLDDCVVDNDPNAMVKNFLHGDGKNRWFDKSFSMLISKDGVGAVNFEHSWGDGVAVLRYFQDIYKDSFNSSFVTPTTAAQNVNCDVRRLSFKLDDRIKSSVNDAVNDYSKICHSLIVDYLILDGFGKNFCKQHSLSPDAIMQLGFQSAYYKHSMGKFAASYESCSTAAFKHGRTETIRPCTTDTKKFCLALHTSNKSSNDELRHLINECSKTHGRLTKEAAMGQGFDRHLFALKLSAKEMGLENVDIFQDPAYSNINTNIISTSTLSSPAVLAGGFGPVVKNGFGIAYVIRDDSLGVLVTSYYGYRDAKDFINCLKESFKEFGQILQYKSK